MGIRTRVWEAHDTIPKASPRQLKLKLEIVDASGGPVCQDVKRGHGLMDPGWE